MIEYKQRAISIVIDEPHYDNVRRHIELKKVGISIEGREESLELWINMLIDKVQYLEKEVADLKHEFRR